MIKKSNIKQLSFEEFDHGLSGMGLAADNRWVIFSKLVDWKAIESVYNQKFNPEEGAPAIDSRIAIGALIIKHLEGLSDERTLEAIQENIYMQYFLGLKSYVAKPVFDSSLFVTIRKRITVEDFALWTEAILAKTKKTDEDKNLDNTKKTDDYKKTDDRSGISSSVVNNSPDATSKSDEPTTTEQKQIENKGRIKIDATVTPADIRYPTDVNLLNDAREKSEELIDKLYLRSTLKKKPRTYRQKARRDFLAYIKKRKHSKPETHKAIKKQLNYLKRNIHSLNLILDDLDNNKIVCDLDARDMKYLYVIQHLYRQQWKMFAEQKNSVEHRIVSIHQPHVRPIVRGKAGSQTEFGAKVNISLIDNIIRVEQMDWEAYNEGTFLIPIIEKYLERTGYYPDLVQVDSIFLNRENRKYMKERNIRHTGKPLGRPVKNTLTPEQLKTRLEETSERNQVEGAFGLGKRRYMLDLVKARLSNTSMSWICASFFAMNLMTIFRQSLLFAYFLSVYYAIRRLIGLFQTLKWTFNREIKLRWNILQRLEHFLLENTCIWVTILNARNF